MATLNDLKSRLRQELSATTSSPTLKLSESQYSEGFEVMREAESRTYQDFIIPQISQLLKSLLESEGGIKILEIGPGPTSIIESLPSHQRERIRKYVAFEPDHLFATKLEKSLWPPSTTEAPLPRLETRPVIHQVSFALNAQSSVPDEDFDVIIFCHSMYGMKAKRAVIEQSLEMLAKGGMVVIFHRDGALYMDGLVSHRTAVYPAGIVRIADKNNVLDKLAPFISGITIQSADLDKQVRIKWREVCRTLGQREEEESEYLLFSAPNVMATFTRNAGALAELTAQVPLVKGERVIKNREAFSHRHAAIVRPINLQQVQECVRWALRYEFSLSIIGGSHSGNCVSLNVVAVDMSAFSNMEIVIAGGRNIVDTSTCIVVQAGCNTGDIIRKTDAAGVTVPLGSRPSVGAGLWLQGGIGHLTRQYGLACDAIIGAVIVSVKSGEILCIGKVPTQHIPVGATRPKNEKDLLWAIKGAGSNFGIVINVVFKTYAAPKYWVRTWAIPLTSNIQRKLQLSKFYDVVKKLPRDSSADAYLYWDNGNFQLGVTLFTSSTTGLESKQEKSMHAVLSTVLGPESDVKIVDTVGLFEAEMYVSMHGGHGGGKTSSFKRCLFLKDIGASGVSDALVAAIQKRPSPLCYLHLLYGGEAVADVKADATAFGYRDWHFACIITGVWPRNDDGTKVARDTIQWVYDVAKDLLPCCEGVYGTDLGPDPRDASLVTKAFGLNLPRLAELKRIFDPKNVLAHACPLPKVLLKPKLVILVTGNSGSGKDYCAGIWSSGLSCQGISSQVVSISDATKREYAKATGADFNRLLSDRAYKEQHRPALMSFFRSQVLQRPRLPEEHFMEAVSSANVDVLLITGMRDEAPLAAFLYLVPDIRMIDVQVKASRKTQKTRGTYYPGTNASNHHVSPLDYRPSLVFDNETDGNRAPEEFGKDFLLPFLSQKLQRLGAMVPSMPGFPRPSIDFRHVLDIAQKPGGLTLCTSLLEDFLLRDQRIRDSGEVDMIVACETGGYLFASALAQQLDKPMALIRQAGKLPPPTFSAPKSQSYISSSNGINDSAGQRIELGRDVIPRGASVVVIDDALATGETLRAGLELLKQAEIQDITVIVLAEFPVHRGRQFLYQQGFGNVAVHSLVVFGGA